MEKAKGLDAHNIAFTTIKSDILNTYHIIADHSKVVFEEINIHNDKEEMYDRFSDTYIPFKYIQFTDGDVVISALSEYIDFAKSFYSSFADNLFSRKATNEVYKFLTENVKDYHLKPYVEYDEDEKYLIIYGLGEKTNINYSKIQQSTIRIHTGTTYVNKTNSYKELFTDRIYYGTLLQDKIVSIVGCNHALPASLSPSVVDIGLETHQDYRQNGYALSNVASISDYLVDHGHVVKYCCNNKNVNSIRTAETIGFKTIAYEKTFWCVNLL